MKPNITNLLKNKLLFCIISAIAASLILSVLLSAGFFSTQSYRISDTLYGEQKPFSDIVIVAIDDKSISDIGRWPWSRTVFAEALGKMKDAKVIGIDVSFLEQEGKAQDEALQNRLNELKGKVILVSECSGFENSSCIKWQKPIFDVETAAANVFTEAGITRAVPKSVGDMDSFSKALAERYANGKIEFKDKNYMRFSNFEEISFSEVLSGNISEDRFKDKIILIGATAKNLHDEQETPIGLLSGIEIHASAIQSALTGKFLSRQSSWSIILWMFLLSLATALILWKFRLTAATISTLALFLAYPIIAIFRFDSGIVHNLLYPLLAILLTYVIIIAVYYLIEARQRKWVSSVLGKYVSDSVAKEIMEKGEDALKLKGNKKIVTVLFADIRGFTSMSEKLRPEQVVAILNRYLDKMTDLVFKHNGTLDKYVGDEIMATYNVPLDMEDHALAAVKTAMDMQKTARKMGTKLKYGIGINTGEAIVGNIGSKRRLDYTVIGDSVNLGARLCSAAKPNQIVISEYTYNLVKGKARTKSLGEIMVKGKKKPIKIYEVVY